jgi:hypothetical protein
MSRIPTPMVENASRVEAAHPAVSPPAYAVTESQPGAECALYGTGVAS